MHNERSKNLQGLYELFSRLADEGLLAMTASDYLRDPGAGRGRLPVFVEMTALLKRRMELGSHGYCGYRGALWFDPRRELEFCAGLTALPIHFCLAGDSSDPQERWAFGSYLLDRMLAVGLHVEWNGRPACAMYLKDR